MCTEQCVQLCILAKFFMNVKRIFALLSLQLHYIHSYLCYLNSSPLLPPSPIWKRLLFSLSLLARTYSMCTSPPLAAVISNYPCRRERESHRRQRRRTFSFPFGLGLWCHGRGGGEGEAATDVISLLICLEDCTQEWKEGRGPLTQG